jgi:peptidoglycan/xylan/chitin deacetylase (PgdA/CDA1 family)
MLHRVQPETSVRFAPNARLSISPAYLAALLSSFRAGDIDVLGLDEALARVHCRTRTRRFVCFTFDDGYRDNVEHALPIFQRFRAPFTVFATTAFADRTLAPWWYALEHVIAREKQVFWLEGQHSQRYATASMPDKQQAFAALSARCFALRAHELAPQLERFLTLHGCSMRELAEREMCDWSELRRLRAAGVEIGCHAASHARLSHETAEGVHAELGSARARLEAELGCPVRHLAYPYGKREHASAREIGIAHTLGFHSAVTTRAGLLYAGHTAHRHALPRIEVTPGFADSPHYLHAILTGLPVIARSRGQRIIHD